MFTLRLWASLALVMAGAATLASINPAKAQGEWLYQDNCAGCHGLHLVPNIPGPKNLKRSVNRLSSEEFIALIRSDDLIGMPDMDYLEDEHLALIYTFIYANKDANYRYNPETVEAPDEEELPEISEPESPQEPSVIANGALPNVLNRPILNRSPLGERSPKKSPRGAVISRRLGEATLVCRANRSMWFEIIRPFTPRWKPRRNYSDSDNNPDTNDATWMVSVYARLETQPTDAPRRGFCAWEDGDLSADAGANREIVIRYRPMSFELPFEALGTAAGRPLPLDLHGGHSYAQGVTQSLYDAIYAIQQFREQRHFRVKVQRIQGEAGPNDAPVFKSIHNDRWGEVALPQPQ